MAMESLTAVAGALIGIAVGSVGTFFLQRISYMRELKERTATAQRQIYVEFLTSVFEMFETIADIHRRLRDGGMSQPEASAALRAVSSQKAQAALENLRLVSDDEVATAAANLWRYMRREPSAVGSDLSSTNHRAWREGYWKARRSVIDAARKGTNLKPLDWSAAGI